MQGLNHKSVITGIVIVVGLFVSATSAIGSNSQSSSDSVVKLTGRLLLADKLVVFARIELAGSRVGDDEQSASVEHLTRARVALDLALELVDDDPELWEMRGELAQAENDDLALINSLRRYCRLVPSDDAAQLRLITAMVNQKQTVQERLKAVSPFLDERRAGAFSVALRSRLASYAAELSHDAGDQGAFARYLKQAIELDSTNVQAILMAIDFSKASNGGARQVGGLLAKAVESDPVDYELRLELGQLLLAVGDYANAAEQIGFAMELATSRPEPDVIYDLILATAGAGRSEEALSMIGQIEQMRVMATAARAHEGEEHAEEEPAGYHEVEPMPLELQLLRLGIAETSGADEVAEVTFQSIKVQLASAVESGDHKAHQDMIRMSLVVNRDLPNAEVVEALLEELADEPVSQAMIGGWYALRQKDMAKARELLGPIGELDPYAGYGLAISWMRDDPEKSKVYLQGVYEAAANKLVGVMAAGVCSEKFDGVARSADATSLGRIIKRWPRSLRRPDFQNRRWTRLDVEIMPEQYEYLEPIYASVQLRNISPRPLAMGEDSSLSSQLFAIMNTDMASNRPMLTVVNVGRRLRLESQESLEMKVRVDRGILGRILSHTPIDKINLSIQAIYSPVSNGYGQFIAGPLGEVDTQRLIERSGVYYSPDSASRWVEHLSHADELTMYQSMARLCGVLPYMNSQPENSDVVEEVSKAINKRFESGDEVEQAWMLWFVSNKFEDRKLFDKVHQIASRTENKMIRIVYLITQVSDPMSTIITRAMRDDDPEVVAFANATMTRIEQQIEEAKAAAEAAAKAEAEFEAGK